MPSVLNQATARSDDLDEAVNRLLRIEATTEAAQYQRHALDMEASRLDLPRIKQG